MLSSFYNSSLFHQYLTTEEDVTQSNVYETPASVTFDASYISTSPRTQRNKKLSIHEATNIPWETKLLCIPPVILPFGRFHLIWSIMLFFILVYTVIETSFTVAFVGPPSMGNNVYLVSLIIDLLLLFDIAINFRTAYVDKYDRLRIIHKPKLIAKHYLLTWFTVDLVGAFPFSLFAIIVYGESAKYLLLFRLLRLIKLIRIVRIMKMFKLFQRQSFQYKTRSTLKLCKIVGFMLLTAHYCACFWYFIGKFTHDSNMNSWIDTVIENESADLYAIPNFKLYSYSIYWSVVTLFTTGYGDIAAHNQYEQWTCIVCILIGSMFFAYFIGIISSLLNEDRVQGHQHQKIEEALLFCSHYNLPKELAQAIITHIRYYQKYNFVFDKREIIDSLPSYLQKSIQRHLAKNILSGLDLFQTLSRSIIGQIALRLKSKSINMGHLLFKAGDIGKELYIQRTGKSKLIFGGNSGSYYTVIQRGHVCGENVIMNRKRLHSVQCETWSEFFSLDIRDIIDVLKNNLDPLTAQKEWEKIKQIVRSTMDSTATRHTNVKTPKFAEYVSSEIFDVNENLKCDIGDSIYTKKDVKNKKLSFQSIQQLFNMEVEQSKLRNEHIINNFSQPKSDVMLKIPDYFEDDISYQNKLEPIDDKSENSEDSGGFGERFGLYKIRKQKKHKTHNITSFVTTIDDILGINHDYSDVNKTDNDIDHGGTKLLQ